MFHLHVNYYWILLIKEETGKDIYSRGHGMLGGCERVWRSCTVGSCSWKQNGLEVRVCWGKAANFFPGHCT